MKQRIVRDYLESLKEDSELDYIFPMLLESMDFRIVTTPRSSKGQPQYGKDVVAIGKDEDGVIHRWYFELKGNADKDIDDNTFNKRDGIRESILAAKDVPYEDSSIPRFNSLPSKIVVVHNGILKENTHEQFDKFICREFPDGGFERWGIEQLTALFTQHLFNEALFCDNESYLLFKKILVMMDAPGWSTTDIDKLIDLQLSYCPTNNNSSRLLVKCFCALNLALNIILHYSQESGILLPAKKSSERIVLKLWAWILKNKKEKNKRVIGIFSRIVELHLAICSAYLQKTIPLATCYKGLYMMHGSETEKVCYPLRCYDFMNDLLYYFIAYNAFCPVITKETLRQQIDIIIAVIRSNTGIDVPLLDSHAITTQLLLWFVLGHEHEETDEKVIYEHIQRLVMNVIIRKRDENMFPELYSNRNQVAKSLYEKSEDYQDSSSLYLMTLVEIVAWMECEPLYRRLREKIEETGVNLQVSYPIESETLECDMFEHRLHEEFSVQTNIKLPESMEDFIKTFRKKYNHIDMRSDKTKFWFLKILAHVHYGTDLFPDFLKLGFWEPLNKE